MSDRGKGKAKVTSRKRKKYQSSTASATSDYAKIYLSDKNKVDQLLLPANAERFPNLYCELRFSLFQQRHLNLEKKLAILSDLRPTLDSVHLRGRQILMTEAGIEEALYCQHKVSDKDSF
ncbi:hypothetical protein AHAS_Ahas14G0135400 [Arachis hypogaea]